MTTTVIQRTAAELDAGLATIRRSPANRGSLRMIVRRPHIDEREPLEVGELDIASGLVGDNWKTRRSSRTDDGSPHPDTQITIMNSRAIALLAGSRDRWALAGDQLFVDLDLGVGNLPPGTRLSIGDSVVEVTAQPHTGCEKFSARFGEAALKFVSSADGRALRLRGLYAKVLRAGEIRVGDVVSKIER